MSILIKGMEMPTEYPLWIVVSADGTVQYNYFNEWKTAEEKAVSIPPHGRLIDADALDDILMNLADNEYTPKVFASWLSYEENAPTIIEAEEGKTWQE